MRKVKVPWPEVVWGARAFGPIEPKAARDARHAESLLEQAVSEALDREADEAGEEGFSVLWASRHLQRQVAAVQGWFRADDETGGRRLGPLLEQALEARGFMLQAGRDRYSLERFHDNFEIRQVRAGPLRLGPNGRWPDGLCFETWEERGVDIERQHRFRLQRCPSCRAMVHPRWLIAGEPTRDAELAVALGEAAYGGCLDGGAADVVCPECEWAFRGR